MICKKCGLEIDPLSRFCSHCGCRVIRDTGENVDTNVDIIIKQKYKPKKRLRILIPWVIPFALLFIAAGTLYLYYRHECEIDKKVEDMRITAENYILEGSFEQAESIINEALLLRPYHSALKTDKEIFEKGESISDIMKVTDNLIKEHEYDIALTKLEFVENEIKTADKVFSGLFLKIIEKKRKTIKLLKLKSEAENKTGFLGLGPLYNEARSVDLPEAYGVAGEIGRYLRDSVVKEVEKCLDAREYDEALDMLVLALRYVPEDLELVKIKEHVLEEKEYYLRNLSIRAAALLGTGDYINDDYLLMAYEIDNSRADVFYIQGNIINKGEETVSSISICFKLYDEIGNFIDEINVPCPVKSIDAGDGAYFDYIYDEPVQVKWIRPFGFEYTLR